MSTSLDYLGRTYDVVAFRGAAARGEVRLDQALAGPGDPGTICTGIQKLAQWFVVELLTARGSRPYDRAGGTRFLPDLIAGRLRTEADVFTAFGFAVGDVQARAAAVEDPAAPADERFAGATLDRVAIAAGLVRLSVSLRSRAGTARPLILPIATVV